MRQEKNRLKAVAAALSLLCAALALLFASSSSPLYATNFWTDTNIYFTIGRGIVRGLAPYRDLFDHKGPLLYLVFALAALVSDTSFFGLFLLEVVSLASALYLSWRIVCLYGEGPLTLAVIAPSAMVTAACTAFTQGGSAEEFCLPALALALLCALRRIREGAHCAAWRRLYLAFGAAMGWVFAVKYTDCGLFFGLGAAVMCWELWTLGLRPAIRAALTVAAGFLLVVLPAALWMAACGALSDCVRVYFIQNMFEYVGEPLTPVGHIVNALAYLRTQSAANPVVAALAVLGCVWTAAFALARREKGFLLEALAVPAGAGLLLLFAYWGEMAHPYYALVFAALSPLGLIPLGWIAKAVRPRAALALALIPALAVVPVCIALCVATPLMGVSREEMAQTVFAQIINREENPTLLDVTSLDQGFYLAAGVTPTVRFFANNNLNTREKLDAIAGYLEGGVTQFVVTCYMDVGERYELVAEYTSPFDLNVPRPYRLYRRIDGI